MSSLNFESPILPELKNKFEKSSYSSKITLTYEDVLDLVHPDSGQQLRNLDLQGLTPCQKRYLYRNFYAPAFENCNTAKLRRRHVIDNQLELSITKANVTLLPAKLQKVVRYFLRERMDVKTVGRKATKLSVNGYLCGIYQRSTRVYQHGRPYIQFVVKSNALRLLDFAILHWEDPEYGMRVYVFPTIDLQSTNGSNGGKIKVFNIPLNKHSPTGRKALVEWEKYRMNWSLLKK